MSFTIHWPGANLGRSRRLLVSHRRARSRLSNWSVMEKKFLCSITVSLRWQYLWYLRIFACPWIKFRYKGICIVTIHNQNGSADRVTKYTICLLPTENQPSTLRLLFFLSYTQHPFLHSTHPSFSFLRVLIEFFRIGEICIFCLYSPCSVLLPFAT